MQSRKSSRRESVASSSLFARFTSIASLALSLWCVGPRVASAQTRRPNASLRLPGLAADLDDPGDDRDWRITTSIDPQTVTVAATAPGGVLAVVFRRARRTHPSCAEYARALFRTQAIDSLRTMQPFVFRGSPWEPQAFSQRTETHDAEFGCIRIGDDVWFASAIAQPRAAVTLSDVASIAARVARGLNGTSRRGYPVMLDAAQLELDDPGDDASWLFLGRAPELLVASDALSSHAGDAGGVSVTVGRRVGTCPAAWNAIRPGLRAEGTLVDRPAYVPDAFGPRIRRIVVDDHLREVYCVGTTDGAVLVTAVFRADDGDAMTRLGPLLRAVARGASNGTGGHGAAPAPSAAERGR